MWGKTRAADGEFAGIQEIAANEGVQPALGIDGLRGDGVLGGRGGDLPALVTRDTGVDECLAGVGRQDHLDGILPAARTPEPGLTPRLADHAPVLVHQPGSGLVGQERTAVVRETDRLAEREVLAGRGHTTAFAGPLADERQQREQRIVDRRPGTQIGGVRCRSAVRVQRCPDVNFATTTPATTVIATNAATRITNVAICMRRQYPP